MGASYVGILVLLWADILAEYTIWVMQTYLTNVWQLSFTHAAGILNFWGGITKILTVVFIFLVDTVLGHYGMLVLSSIAYSLGMGILSMSTPPVLSSSCKNYEPKCIGDTQKVLFYTALALIAVGISGHLISLNPFLEKQRKNHCAAELLRVLGIIVPIIGGIALSFLKPWSIRFGIPAICTAVATLVFLSGSCLYRSKSHSQPKGSSPLTNVCRVFVASAFKISRPRPLDDKELYEKDGTRFSPTLRCLEKAAIILPDKSLEEQEKNRWRLCTISQVEEAKIVVRMVPMWMTFIVCGIVSSIGNTYFVEQANHMDQKLVKWKAPLPILLMLFNSVKPIFAKLYFYMTDYFSDRCEKYAPPVGIAMAMVLSILCCITAAIVEIRRLNVIRSQGLLDKPEAEIPMSMFWLIFQFSLLAGLDEFFGQGVEAFFDNQAPESMTDYLVCFTQGVSGLGFMGSVLVVNVVGEVSEKGGSRPNWFQYTLNRSRLDRYYWVLAALSSANLLVYILIASCYRYKEPAGLESGNENEINEDYGQLIPVNN